MNEKSKHRTQDFTLIFNEVKFSNNKLTLCVPDRGELIIDILKERSAGLSYYFDIEINLNGISKITVKDFEVPYFWSIGEVFCSEFLHEGIWSEMIAFLRSENDDYGKVINAYQKSYKIKYDFHDSRAQILKRVKLEGAGEHFRDTKYFEFKKFVGICDGCLTVDYSGHEVGGSYIPEEKVIPGYIKRIEEATNKKCEFVKRSSGGFGFDIYRFNIMTR